MLQLQLYIKTPVTVIQGDEVTADSTLFTADNGTSMNLLNGPNETIERDDFERIELFEDESVTLTQNIQDVKDISKIFTDYSQTFSVPASKRNNKIFKHFYNYFINGFDAREKKDAKIELNYKPFKTGKIKLEGTTLKGNKAHTYKLTFYGSTVNLKDLIGDIKINGLAYFNDSSFSYSAANVKTLLSNAGNLNVAGTTWPDSVLFPLITHTDRLYYDTGTDGANANNQANIRWNPSGDTAQGLSYTQLKPAIRIYPIFKAIEYQFSEIKFGGEFMKQSNTDLYSLFMWLNIKEGDLIQSTDTTYNALSPNTDVVRNSKADRKRSEFCDIFPNGSFQVLQGRKTKRLTANFSSSAAGEYSIAVRRDGELVAEYDGLTGASSPIENLELQTGRYTVQVGATAAANFTAEYKVDALYSGRDAIVTWKATGSVLSSQQVWIKDHLPEIGVLEFLTGIFKMFNLTAYVDDDGITQIQTLDSYYAGTTDTPVSYYDITKDVDVAKTQIDSVLPFNQISFEYEGTENFFANDHENRFNTKWGSLEYKNEVFEGDTYEVKIPFEHFKYERLYNQTGGTSTTIMWGWGVDKDKNAAVGEPLLFYPILTTNVSVGQTPTSISFIGDSGHEEVTSYYLASNSKSFSSSSQGEDVSNNLNFNAEMNEYALRPFEKTLFKQYYETYIKDIFKPERRLTKLDAFIPLGTITKLKLYDRLVIDDKVFKINKMTTNFLTERSQLELVNVFDDREIVQNLLQSVGTIDNDTKTVGITADSTLVTVDAGPDVDLVIETPIKEVPKTIPSNIPTPVNNVPCTVTAATLADVDQVANTNSSVYFKHRIAGIGLICETPTLESFGFIHAATEALLTGTDLEALIATNGVTNLNYIPNNVHDIAYLVRSYSVEISGLSQGTVKFWRFYARTNSTSNYEIVNVMSDIKSAIAEAAPAYTETTGVQGYGITQDSHIRTIRLMDIDGNLYDYKGLASGFPVYSKIAPYVVEGLPATITNLSGTYPIFGFGLSVGGASYHATDRQIAINGAKSNGVGNTGGVSISIGVQNTLSEAEEIENGGMVFVLRHEGIALYNPNTNYAAPNYVADGFYASKDNLVSTDPSDAIGVSIKLVNGIITDRQTFTN